MQTEIEAKFLRVDHDNIRQILQSHGAELEAPMRLMRRTVFDYPDMRFEKSGSRLRVRDEGDKVTITFKSLQKDSPYPNEIETTIGSYEVAVELLKATGFVAYSAQESKRETWQLDGNEVVLDEWPWVKPYIEIEGPSETSIQACAAKLGLDWADAQYGSVETVYRSEYPGIQPTEGLSEISEVRFGAPLPEWLEKRR